MSETYKDGVGIERCSVCRSALRAKDGEPLAYLSWSVLELLAQILRDGGMYLTKAKALELVQLLEQAAGRTVKQMADSAEAIPDSVKTDRGGLPLEEG